MRALKLRLDRLERGGGAAACPHCGRDGLGGERLAWEWCEGVSGDEAQAHCRGCGRLTLLHLAFDPHRDESPAS